MDNRFAPLDDAGLVSAMRLLHVAVDRLDTRAAERLGIARNDLRCLNLLEHGALAPRMIGERLGLTSGSVTALVDRLEQQGYVRRKPDASDRRAVLVEATPLARARLLAAYRPVGEAMAKLGERYGGERAAAAAKHISDAARICEWAATKIDGAQGE
jgi:DNA-binding MarR family transcriptional regulator